MIALVHMKRETVQNLYRADQGAVINYNKVLLTNCGSIRLWATDRDAAIKAVAHIAVRCAEDLGEPLGQVLTDVTVTAVGIKKEVGDSGLVATLKCIGLPSPYSVP